MPECIILADTDRTQYINRINHANNVINILTNLPRREFYSYKLNVLQILFEDDTFIINGAMRYRKNKFIAFLRSMIRQWHHALNLGYIDIP